MLSKKLPFVCALLLLGLPVAGCNSNLSEPNTSTVSAPERANVKLKLKALIESLEQEAARIQVQGRALFPSELKRLEQINAALPLLRDALYKLSK